MEVKPGYKQTEVGVIPADWEVSSLEGMVTILHGYAFQSEYFADNGNYKLTTPGHFHETGGFRELGEKQKYYSGPVPYGYVLAKGDMLVAMTEQADGLLGSAAFIPEDCVYLHNQRLGKIHIVSSSVHLGYLFRVFNSPLYRKQVHETAAGTKVKHTSPKKLNRIVVILPTRGEQEAIAGALSDADGLIESLEQLVAKKRQIKHGAMQQLLTGQNRLPGFTGDWQTRRLEEITHIKTGSRNNEDKIEDGEYPFFVRSENVERINSYSCDCEAILVPGEGRIGDIFHYINGRFDVHQRVYAITQFAPSICAKFVHFYMTMNFGVWAMQNTVKATVDSLRLPTFQTFEMRVPPTKDEQTAIAAVLSDMDAEITALEAKLTKARQVKQGMMQELLTGRIRLV